MNSLTINNQNLSKRSVNNEQLWQLATKTCKPRTPDETEIRTAIINKTENAAQQKFTHETGPDGINSVKNSKKFTAQKKNSQAEMKLAELTQEKLNLLNECNSLKKSVKDKTQKLKQAEKKEVELTEKVQQLDLDIKSITVKFQNASKEVQSQCRKFDEISKKLKSLENLLKEKSEELMFSDVKAQEFSALRETLEAQIQGLMQENGNLHIRLEGLSIECNEKIEASQLNLLGAQSQIKEQDKEIEQLNLSLLELTENNIHFKSEIEQINRHCKSLEDTVKNQNQKLKLSKQKEKVAEDQAHTLLSENWALTDQLKTTMQKLIRTKNLLGDKEQLEETQKSLYKLLQEKKVEIEQKLNENDQLKNENRQLVEEYQLACTLNKDLQQKQDDTIQDLIQQKQIIQTELEEAKQTLKNKEIALKMIEVKNIEVINQACKPTAVDLMVTLKKIKANIEVLETFLKRNKNANDKFTTKLNSIKETGVQDLPVLQLHLDQMDPIYDELIKSYADILEKYQPLKADIKYCIDDSIKYVPIPASLLNSISARFSIPVDDLSSRNALFDAAKESCIKAFKELEDLHDTSKKAIDAFKKDLNALDIEIVTIKKPIGVIERVTTGYVASKIRLSPLDSAFSEKAIQ